MGSGFSKMKKQARMLEQQMAQARSEMASKEIEGSSGGNLVHVVIDGEMKIKKITIQPDCVDKEDIEGLQDLIIAALEDAYSKVEEPMGDLSSLFPM